MFAQAPTPSTSGTAAEAGPPKKDDIQGAVRSPDFLLYSAILAGLLFAAAAVFYIADRWRKARPVADTDRDASLSLSSFREMYENGEITEKEYQKLRDKMAAKIKKTVGISPSAPVVSTDPTRSQPMRPTPPPPPDQPPDPAK